MDYLTNKIKQASQHFSYPGVLIVEPFPLITSYDKNTKGCLEVCVCFNIRAYRKRWFPRNTTCGHLNQMNVTI